MKKAISKAERTRNFIIENTAEIFNKKGYAGTSLSDLTDATGLTKGSIYGNFENKEEVAMAAFDHNVALITQRITGLIEKEKTYYDKLLVYAKVYKNVSRGTTANRGGCPILNTATEADDTNAMLKLRAAKAVINWEKRITDLISGGIAAGEFKEDVNVKQTALSIIALIEGGVMISRVTADPANMDIITNTIEALIHQMKK
ncbi:MAG TPA: TetR/AcrR family transcriptional regulator [Mucilaginibacter sp.]